MAVAECFHGVQAVTQSPAVRQLNIEPGAGVQFQNERSEIAIEHDGDRPLRPVARLQGVVQEDPRRPGLEGPGEPGADKENPT